MLDKELEVSSTSKYIGKFSKEELFGDWKLISDVVWVTKDKRQSGIYLQCLCNICLVVEQFVNIQCLKRYRIANRGGCKSCSRKKHTPCGTASNRWKGIGDIPMSYIHNIKNAAMRRHIVFSISPAYLWDLFLEQNKMCKLSGVKLNFPTRINLRDGTASLDRIDRTKGYVEGNVQWIHKDVNEMKWDRSDIEFINWCKVIAEFNNY